MFSHYAISKISSICKISIFFEDLSFLSPRSLLKLKLWYTRFFMQAVTLGLTSEAVIQWCSVKEVLLQILKTSQENTCVPESLYNKVASLRPATLFKKRLCQRCFPVNFIKFIRTPIFF